MNIGTKPPPPPAPAPEPPKPEPAPEPEPEPPKPEQVKLPGPVVFQTGSAKLAPESDAVLVVVQKYLETRPEITQLRIEGHTDNVGKPAANQSLSERRAMSVAAWLVGKGIDCKRLVPVGFGESKPIAENETPEGRAQNRRTAFFAAEKNGQLLGGLPADGGGTVAGDPCQ